MEDKVVFDIAVLLGSTCDDRELAGQVVGVFLADVPVQFTDLLAALDRSDAATAERAAHSIKGAAATVGGGLLRDAAYECEICGKAGDLDGMRRLLPEMRARYDVLRAALEASGLAVEL